MVLALAGKVALVTGASSGIGEATARALASAGTTVAMFARRGERLDKLVAEFEAKGGKALAIVGDGTIEADATSAVAKVIDAFGRIDILINNAGIIQHAPIENADLANYRRVMDINLMATVYTCAAAIGPMKAQGEGDIVNVASMAARKPSARFNSYGASKHAVHAMTEGLRQEVGLAGIRVCVVMPGATSTEVGDNMNDPAMREFMLNHVHKDGAMKPEEVADAILFQLGLPRRTNIAEIHIRPTIDI